MESSTITGVYHTLEMAVENLLKMVDAINKRISRTNGEFDNPFEPDEIGEDEENILVRYRNGVSSMVSRNVFRMSLMMTACFCTTITR